MRFLRNLIQNANLLNVLLAIIVLTFAAEIIISVIRMRHLYAVPRIKERTPAPAVQPVDVPQKMPSDYAVIGDTNVFHPDRTIPVDKKAEVPRPEIVLFGTLVDTDRLAFIEDKKNPVTTPGRGNRQRVVRKGEVVSGYTVTDIMNDRITLARGDDRITFMLSDPKRRGSEQGQPGEPPAPAGPGTFPARPSQPPRAPAKPGTSPAVSHPPQSPGSLPVGETQRPRLNQPSATPSGSQTPPRRTPE
jgi:type II secretory pathway component PulC